MKKSFKTHILVLFVYFLLIVLVQRWFELRYLYFIFGGVLGALLPYSDYLVYVFFLRPQEEISMQAFNLLNNRQVIKAFSLLIENTEKRTAQVLHTAHFNVIFLILTFLVMTSSGSLFGRGLVLSFSLHLLVDQLIDYRNFGNLDVWFEKTGIVLEKQFQNLYLLINSLVLLAFGIFM